MLRSGAAAACRARRAVVKKLVDLVGLVVRRDPHRNATSRQLRGICTKDDTLKVSSRMHTSTVRSATHLDARHEMADWLGACLRWERARMRVVASMATPSQRVQEMSVSSNWFNVTCKYKNVFETTGPPGAGTGELAQNGFGIYAKRAIQKVPGHGGDRISSKNRNRGTRTVPPDRKQTLSRPFFRLRVLW